MGRDEQDGLRTHVFVCNVTKGVVENPHKRKLEFIHCTNSNLNFNQEEEG